jgi:hypothetical protein
MPHARPFRSLIVCAALALSAAALGLVTPSASAQDASDSVQLTNPKKELMFTPTELRLFKDPDSGKHYWYMTYEVVNKTGAEIRFSPRIELVVDDGVILGQGEGVPSGVIQKLKKHLGDALLEDHFEILGEVLPGKENAKSGLVVFRADKLDPTELTVMVQGLSRETEKKPHPKTGEPVVLRKTVRIDYLVPGDPKPRGSATYPIVQQGWIFR